MKIREAKIDDFETIGTLFFESDNFHSVNQPDIYRETLEVSRNRDYIASIINDPKAMFYVAEEDNRVVGFINGFEESKGFLPFHKERTFFSIDNIVVSKEYQSKGYGKKLLKKIEDESRSKGYSDIILNVYSFNSSAIGLYKSRGFKEISKEMILKL